MAATDFQSLLTLIDKEIPDVRKSLQENYSNLERVAQYCESNYLQASDKRKALEETKNYTTHSLASVAYQVNQLASSFLRLLTLQQSHLAGMESSVNHLNQIVMIHKEKVARREIGVLTTNRTACRPIGVKSGILFPEQTERPVKYTRKAIDYSSLDDIGHGVRPQAQQGSTPRAGRSPSVSSSSSGSQAPTTRPPTPPQYRHSSQAGGSAGTGGTGGSSGGTLGRSGGEGGRAAGHYRSIPPPAVPSNPSALPQTPQSSAAQSPGQHSPGNNSQGGARSQATYAPMVQMGQVRVPQGMMGRVGAPMGRDSLMMMGPQPGMGAGMGVPDMGYPGPRPRSGASHFMQQASGALPGQEVMGSSSCQDALSPPDREEPALLMIRDLICYIENLLLEASPPLPPPPESGMAFDYQIAPLPPPEFSDRGGNGELNLQQAAPEDPYAATGPGFLGPDEFMPANYIEKVVAIYDYEADKEDELTFSENSVIYVIRKNDDGWWEGVMDGVTGLFPSNYVEPCM